MRPLRSHDPGGARAGANAAEPNPTGAIENADAFSPRHRVFNLPVSRSPAEGSFMRDATASRSPRLRGGADSQATNGAFVPWKGRAPRGSPAEGSLMRDATASRSPRLRGGADSQATNGAFVPWRGRAPRATRLGLSHARGEPLALPGRGLRAGASLCVEQFRQLVQQAFATDVLGEYFAFGVDQHVHRNRQDAEQGRNGAVVGLEITGVGPRDLVFQ